MQSSSNHKVIIYPLLKHGVQCKKTPE